MLDPRSPADSMSPSSQYQSPSLARPSYPVRLTPLHRCSRSRASTFPPSSVIPTSPFLPPSGDCKACPTEETGTLRKQSHPSILARSLRIIRLLKTGTPPEGSAFRHRDPSKVARAETLSQRMKERIKKSMRRSTLPTASPPQMAPILVKLPVPCPPEDHLPPRRVFYLRAVPSDPHIPEGLPTFPLSLPAELSGISGPKKDQRDSRRLPHVLEGEAEKSEGQGEDNTEDCSMVSDGPGGPSMSGLDPLFRMPLLAASSTYQIPSPPRSRITSHSIATHPSIRSLASSVPSFSTSKEHDGSLPPRFNHEGRQRHSYPPSRDRRLADSPDDDEQLTFEAWKRVQEWLRGSPDSESRVLLLGSPFQPSRSPSGPHSPARSDEIRKFAEWRKTFGKRATPLEESEETVLQVDLGREGISLSEYKVRGLIPRQLRKLLVDTLRPNRPRRTSLSPVPYPDYYKVQVERAFRKEKSTPTTSNVDPSAELIAWGEKGRREVAESLLPGAPLTSLPSRRMGNGLLYPTARRSESIHAKQSDPIDVRFVGFDSSWRGAQSGPRMEVELLALARWKGEGRNADMEGKKMALHNSEGNGEGESEGSSRPLEELEDGGRRDNIAPTEM
ncbi:hypothetical protein P7C73_g4245, partial [Tremellales sp. Uapishka_1]